MIEERATIMENNVRVRMIGRRDDIPATSVAGARQNRRYEPDQQRMWLNLAINYGSRAEIVDAVRSIADGVHHGKLLPTGHR